MDKLALYAYGNVVVFLVLLATGYRDWATVLAIISASVFVARRVEQGIAHPVRN